MWHFGATDQQTPSPASLAPYPIPWPSSIPHVRTLFPHFSCPYQIKTSGTWAQAHAQGGPSFVLLASLDSYVVNYVVEYVVKQLIHGHCTQSSRHSTRTRGHRAQVEARGAQ